MKKFLSLILALAMVACMSVTAFAADGTTVLTAEIPNEPSYTLHIPANMTLEYGNTGMQTIGDLSVTDVDGYDLIWCAPKYTDLINTADSTDSISLVLYDDSDNFSQQELKKNGNEVQDNATPTLFIKNFSQYAGWSDSYNNYSLSAQVSDWSGATPGATYQATITYVVTAR